MIWVSHFQGDDKVIQGTLDEVIKQLPGDISGSLAESKKSSIVYRAKKSTSAGTANSFGKVKRTKLFRKKGTENAEKQ